MLKENLVGEIERSIRRNWDLPAFSDYGHSSRTYGQVGQSLLSWHLLFGENNLKKGDKVAVIGKNSSNWAEIYLATITYGAVIVPVLADFTPDNIHHIINHSESKFLFTADQINENLDVSKMKCIEAIFSLTDFSLLYNKNKNLAQQIASAQQKFRSKYSNLAPEKYRLEEIPNQELAAIVYTSGTTGFSKGVMLNHNALTANIKYAQENMPLTAGSRILSFLPMAHAYACAFEFIFPFTIGCYTTFLNRLPTPQILIKAFSEIQPNLIFLVPLLIEKIYRNKIKPSLDKPAMKLALKVPGLKGVVMKKIRQKLLDLFGGNFKEVVIGGAALNPEVENFLREIKFPFTNGYGMTECAPLISYAPWDQIKPYSVGRLINYLEIRIDSANPVREPGEILIKGENVMMGYYKNEEATTETLEKDGWLHTGDLGLLDEDGFIFIKGRSKNMILGPSGQNIYPEEIEGVLNNLPYVQESLILENQGKLIALVFPDLQWADADKVPEKDLQAKMDQNLKNLNAELPSYSKISAIKLYPEEFEKTPTKKIKRFLYNITS
ncbi:MAG: AMP-binding protein [Candidatus Cyclobacteriaceae bacterium M3_2C_046]